MKISIITINYNNKAGLEKTIDSVRSQTDKNFEYIVIDGGSDDGSVEVIHKNEDIVDIWVSEHDKGIYNAMNKGVNRASGEYCLFLNSGDFLHAPDVMEKVLVENLESDLIFGRVENFFPDGKKKLYVPRNEMTLMWVIRTGIHHAGSFIRTSLMKKYPYDESLKICSDRKFFVQALILDNCTFQNLDFIVSDFEMGGVSNTDNSLTISEYWQVMEDLFPPRLVKDYRKSNEVIMDMSSHLVLCRYKIVSFVCRLNIFIIKFFRLILGSKIYCS